MRTDGDILENRAKGWEGEHAGAAGAATLGGRAGALVPLPGVLSVFVLPWPGWISGEAGPALRL